MHPNPIYRRSPQDAALAEAGARGFGMLTLAGSDGPLATHIPFDLAPSGDHLTFHLVRSNPLARADFAQPALLAVTGPDAYISPDWYGTPDQVPTWNYIAIHLRGRISPLPDSDLRRILDDLSARFERQLAPKPVWRAAKMDHDALTRMMRQIVPFRMDITSVESTVKLNQNKTAAQRAGVIAALDTSPIGADIEKLAARMRLLQDTA